MLRRSLSAVKTFFPPSASSARFLHTEQKFIVKNKKEKIGAIILKTHNDRQEDEDSEEYIERSLLELSDQIPEDMQNTPLLMFKVNQSVIDSQELMMNDKIVPLYQGHTFSCISQVQPNSVEIFKDSLVSKVPRTPIPFEGAPKTIEASSSRASKAMKTGSGEYYVFIAFDNTKMTIEQYQERRQRLLDHNDAYSQLSNACGHAVYEACTGKPLEREPISAQLATSKTIREILNDEDPDFTNTFISAMIESDFSLRGEEINEKQLLAQPSSPSPDI